MSKKRYVVKLGADERKRLEDLIRKGKSPAKKQLKARILLPADESPLGPRWNDPKISEALGTYPMMCARVRQQWAQGGMDAVLNRKQRAAPPVPHIFDGEKGCTGRLQAATRRRLSAGLSGRGVQTTACRHTGADPDEAGTIGAPRLEERKRLDELIRKGKSPAKKQLKARILLRADGSPLGPNHSLPII